MPSDYKTHKVRQGECISSIAHRYGHFWETIWNDAKNANLKALRKDHNVLLPGDILHVPPIRSKETSIATQQTHRFVRKGVPAKLRLRFVAEPVHEIGITDNEEDSVPAQGLDRATEEKTQKQPPPPEPRANAPYSIEIDGERTTGSLDGDGVMEVVVPPNARKAKITIDAGTDRQTDLEVDLGHLDPITEVSGVKQRLANLSYECGDRTAEESEALSQAIARFQEDNDMPVTGDLSQTVRDKLLELHGS